MLLLLFVDRIVDACSDALELDDELALELKVEDASMLLEDVGAEEVKDVDEPAGLELAVDDVAGEGLGLMLELGTVDDP